MNFLDAVMLNTALMYSGSIGTFIQTMGKNVGSWVKMIVMIIGVIMVGAGIYQVAKNLISHGKGQTNWIVTLALIIFGAILMLTGGWDFIKTFSSAGKTTLNNAANGTDDKKNLTDSDFTVIFDH
jgi:hypothetical protein